MVSTEGGFRARAATLLQSASPFHGQNTSPEPYSAYPLSQSTFPQSGAEISQIDGIHTIDASTSISSNDRTAVSSGDDAIAEDRAANRLVRTLPTWAKVPEEYEEEEDSSSHLLPKAPPEAQIAQHNSSPSSKNKRHEPGHLWDMERESTPPTTRHHISEIGSRWRAFAEGSALPTVSRESGQRVTEDWLVEHGPDYSQPWRPTVDDDSEKQNGRVSKSRRRAWWKRLQHTILRNPAVPLVLRTIVWIFSACALAIGARAYHEYPSSSTAQIHSASPVMAIIVDAIALVYIIYITHDEYTGKPLGLRSARAKMRLIFLDLFFIVFDSANLSLAFEAISNSNVPPSCLLGLYVCDLQQALASVLLIALIAWMMTFAISVLRVVERVVQK